MKRIIYAAVLCLFAVSSQAQTPAPRSISVVGEAEVKAVPDQAVVNVTVYTESQNLAQAKKANDQKLQKLLSLAADAGIERDQIKTLFASVQPKYRYENETNKQLFDGYTVSNSVELTLRKLDASGNFVNSLVTGGFDRIDGINYILSDRSQYEEKAMLTAMGNAREKAEKMAAQLDEKIGRPLAITEQGAMALSPMPVSMPKMEAYAMRGVAADVPATPGLIIITQRVTVSFELQ